MRSGRVAVKGSFDPVLELIDHNLLDDAIDSLATLLKICFAFKQLLQKAVEAFVEVARSKEASYFGMRFSSSKDIAMASSLVTYHQVEPPPG